MENPEITHTVSKGVSILAGRLEVIRGCMFSGKTEELLRRVKRLEYANQKYLAFKLKIDKRYSESDIVSHNGISIPAISVNHPEEIVRHIYKNKEKADVVAIDEAQFFLTHEIVNCVEFLVGEGYRVIVAGLDTDYRGDVFGFVGDLLAVCDEDIHLKAVCAVCGGEADRTQLLVNNKPAKESEPVILVGGNDDFGPHGKKYKYQARCRSCHKIG